jgi:hydroxyacylglutathione hydrolase
VGYERRFNAALRLALDDPAAFVDAVLDGQPEPPPYFAAMKRLNKIGPPRLPELPLPRRLSDESLVAAVSARDALVLDTRPSRRAFMERHLPGSLYAPLDRTFSTVVGSYARPDETIVLLIDPATVASAVRQLVRIGFDRIAGFASPEDLSALARDGRVPVSSIPVCGFEQARAGAGSRVVLDVRSAAEFEAGHLPGAINIPHTRLVPRLGELPAGRALVVHCASGARAAVAAAALRRFGFDVTYLDEAYQAVTA